MVSHSRAALDAPAPGEGRPEEGCGRAHAGAWRDRDFALDFDCDLALFECVSSYGAVAPSRVDFNCVGSCGAVVVSRPCSWPRRDAARSPPHERGQGSPPEDPFAPFARALGIEVPAEPAALSLAEEEEDARVAGLVRERFAANRPQPASFPAIALEVLNLVARQDAAAADLAPLIARDPALSAGVLSVANSALYRGLMDVETVRDAVTRLGLAEVARIAAAVSARTLFSPRLRAEQAAFGGRSKDLFVRAVAVGSAAAALALRRPGARADRAYLGGLLHDVGKALALSALAGHVIDAHGGAPVPERLERVLDRLHVELGGEAHQAWGLPQYLTVMCVRHHDEEIPGDAEFGDLHLVRLTSALADVSDARLAARAAREVAQSAGALALDPFAVRALASELRQAQERARAAFAPRKI